jgi:hypothetical protein
MQQVSVCSVCIVGVGVCGEKKCDDVVDFVRKEGRSVMRASADMAMLLFTKQLWKVIHLC